MAAKPKKGASVDWREETLNNMRALILKAVPTMLEEQKWRKPSNGMKGVPVWSHNGIVCTGETYKNVVKLTFAKGAGLADPAGLFNASLEGNTRRAIDIPEGGKVNATAFKALVREAVAANGAKNSTNSKKSKDSGKVTAKALPMTVPKTMKPVKLLSGGNPQIAKGEGNVPVQAFIAAMPGWKRDVGRRLDALIVRTVPGVRKAMKWNTPFYGIEGNGWFLGFHCVTHYVKVAFFRGAALRPLPPIESKQKEVRYFHIHEGDKINEAQLARWIKQAVALPGWMAK